MMVRGAQEHYFVMFIEKKIFSIIKISSSMSFEASSSSSSSLIQQGLVSKGAVNHWGWENLKR